MSTMLEVRDLHVAYGKVEAVHGVSLAVDEGSIVTVIGPNGAGKTTLLGAVMGLLPSRGSIAYAGAPLARSSVEQRVHRLECQPGTDQDDHRSHKQRGDRVSLGQPGNSKFPAD